VAKLELKVPDIGGAEGAEVIELLVAVGDRVELEQSLIVLESDKASMEIPATAAGTIVELLVSEGQELNEGSVIVVVETADSAAAELPGDVGEALEVAAPVTADSVSKHEVKVPDIGGSESAEVIELLVAVGDEVDLDQSLIVLESDKASMEIPSTAAGKVLELLVSEGDALSEGVSIVIIESASSAEASDNKAAIPRVAADVMPSAPVVSAAIALASGAKNTYAGPAVRKLAREFGVDLALVSASGPRGRVLKEDLHEHVKNALKNETSAPSVGTGIPSVPEVDFAAFGEVDVQPMSKMAKLTAANMQRSWLNVPHVTQFDDADITELELFRKGLKGEADARGTKMTPMPFILKACAVALRDNPKFCSSLSGAGQNLSYKKYIHIGMAVDTPAGLLVPVIRDVDKKSLWEVAEEMIELAGKARDRKLRPEEMRGGCFTISSLGGIGGRGFTPIVNSPEVGILGVSKAEVRPVWDGSEFQPRKMLPLALSYDHRVINGGDAGRFLTQYVSLLSDIRRLVL
ncbi:UNVERIFIED_CONTAM: hypothetical protein GTU68_047277, partial [Idotea baltica]|nr:hypothetical protein [Idotea baltica]